MNAWDLSGSLLRLVVLVGALAWIPLWRRRAGGRLRTYVAIAIGLGLLVGSEGLTLHRLVAASDWFAWPTVYLHAVGYIAILCAFLLWVRDVSDSKRHAASRLQDERRRLHEVRLHEAKLQAILNCATEYGIVVCDPEGLITSYSSGGARILGWSAGEVVGKLKVAALRPDGSAPGMDEIRRAVEDRGYFEDEVTFLRKSGEEFPALLTMTPLKGPEGEELGYVGIVKDITDLKSVQEDLRRERDFIRGVVETSELFIVGVSMADGRITMFNRGAEQISGYKRDEVIGKSYTDTFLPPDVRGEVVERLKRLVEEPGTQIAHGENPILTKDGEQRIVSWTNSLCEDETGQATILVAFGHDVTERRQMEQDLERAKIDLEKVNSDLRQMAETDFLTGLVNRRQSMLQFGRELARSKRNYAFLGVIMVDLDRFKPVNDTYGHQAGDAVLSHVAGLLRKRARESDIVARYGGEEFLIVLPEADLEATVRVAQQMRRLLRDNPARYEDVELPIRASFGVTEFHPGLNVTVKQLIGRADEALYAAKGLGGNRVVTWGQLNEGNVEPAVVNSEAIQELRKEVREITRSNQEAIVDRFEALVGKIEGRSIYTAGHSHRVSEYATAIAREMDLDADQVETIRRASLLHDLGRAGIPGSVLWKNEKLTMDDWALVMQHPSVGVRIISDLPFLKNEVPLIRHHHERPDGRGYPDGLPGPSIPPGARILAVADAFDAMTSDRPYRSALTKEAALKELRDGAGKVFDEPAVKAALACAEANEDWPLPQAEAAEPVGAGAAEEAGS